MKDKKILITGSSGQLGKEFQKILLERGVYFFAPEKAERDITNFRQVKELINRIKPTVIINCAAYNAVDEAEGKPELAYMVNSSAVENLAKLCKENNIFFIHYSSDYVFDGNKQDLYVEDDTPNPLNVYGKSKLSGEQVVSKILSDFLIFRVS
ncbi:NAD(P)-dependent oxidoreductase, partial [bacterium]|nr:NAD(P)-dependent oxidoreductase [bacterium]